MGGAPIESSDLHSYYSSNTHIRHATSAREVFKETRIFNAFDPSKMKLPREALDSNLSPKSRPIILAEDTTGSMDWALLEIIRDQFPDLINLIYKTASYNPHIMFMGIGDVAAYDEAPLQVTQFETDLRILDQLQKIWIEGCGGGNGSESYILAWYFAAKHTYVDSWEKRREKGFIFTFGDDGPTLSLNKGEIKRVFGDNDNLEVYSITNKDCLEMASEKFNCYHIILHGAAYSRYHVNDWKDLMGSHVCDLSDYKCMPELVTTILKMYEGKTKTEAINEISNAHKKSIVAKALEYHEEVVEQSNNSDSTEENANIEVL